MEHAFNAKDCVQGERANDNVGDLEWECLDLLWSNNMSSSTCDFASILADIDDALGDNNATASQVLYTGCVGDDIASLMSNNIKEMFCTCGNDDVDASHMLCTRCIEDALVNNLSSISSQVALQSANQAEVLRVTGHGAVEDVADDDQLGRTMSVSIGEILLANADFLMEDVCNMFLTFPD